jgi:protein-S-isoprenylcysteine O-methyltransferase Ste14
MKAVIPPPLVLLICGALMWLTARMWPSLDFTFPYNTLVFWIVLLAGLSLLIAGVVRIMKHETVIHPDRDSLSKATVLVTTGVFRYTRNPIYLGMAIMLMAWTIYLENWLSAVVVIIFVAFITRYQIKPEEEVLEKIFGAEYVRYKKKVRRWV